MSRTTCLVLKISSFHEPISLIKYVAVEIQLEKNNENDCK